MKCFSSRFLILPHIQDVNKLIHEHNRGDIFNKFFDSEELESNFIRFVESMNRLRNNAIPGNKNLNSSLLGNGSRPGTPLKHLESVMADMPQYFSSEKAEILDGWTKFLAQTPLTILPKQTTTLPNTVFISYDFISFLRKHVADFQTNEEAIEFATKLIEEDKIRLISPVANGENSDMESCKSSDYNDNHFRYGFYLYILVTDKLQEHLEQIDVRGKIQVEITGHCTTSPGECKYRTKGEIMEFNSSSFTIRQQENRFIEWSRVNSFWHRL
uniref:GPN-loop GTPase 3 n=1 Tax=Acrobeloides nanus TaxID=290746 RepID=A0A914C257_9BILA